jgi:hypothetical protein
VKEKRWPVVPLRPYMANNEACTVPTLKTFCKEYRFFKNILKIFKLLSFSKKMVLLDLPLYRLGLIIHALPPVQGEWGEVNDTQCNYVSEVTDKLYKFANMNHTGFHQTTLLQAAGMVPV